MKLNSCRTCGAPIVWTRTRAGKAMPTEPDSMDEADLEYNDQAEPYFDPETHESHFARCPQAPAWRRG